MVQGNVWRIVLANNKKTKKYRQLNQFGQYCALLNAGFAPDLPKALVWKRKGQSWNIHPTSAVSIGTRHYEYQANVKWVMLYAWLSISKPRRPDLRVGKK